MRLGELKEEKSLKDMSGQKCPCGGTYQETGIQDDMHGVLHCSKCNKEVKRHKPVKEATALSQQYGGKKAKMLSYSQAIRWLARDMGSEDSHGMAIIAAIYGREYKEVKRDVIQADNAMRAAK
jgi:hypothetical protein